MIQFQVKDISIEDITKKQYDIAVFASGFESRSINVPSLIDPNKVNYPLIFGFTEKSNEGTRDINNKFFLNRWKCSPIPLSRDDEKPIYESLSLHTKSIDRPINILVDYSSMSRLWYAAVLNWARFTASYKDVIIDFIYSVGKYKEEKYPMVIREMVPIPGCEGRAFRHRESIAVFGLGFHGMAALCVLDRLEVDTVFTFLAIHEASKENVNKTRVANEELINDRKNKGNFELPLASIETSYRNLANLISPYRPEGEITLVPMGPKPHVLASILVAMRFKEVACLRVSGDSESLDIEVTGELVTSQVIINNNNIIH